MTGKDVTKKLRSDFFDKYSSKENLKEVDNKNYISKQELSEYTFMWNNLSRAIAFY